MTLVARSSLSTLITKDQSPGCVVVKYFKSMHVCDLFLSREKKKNPQLLTMLNKICVFDQVKTI